MFNLIDKLDSIFGSIVVKQPTECEEISNQQNAQARLAAEMNIAINITDDLFIKQQLEYRRANGNYDYHDLVSRTKVLEAMSKS